MSLDAVPDADEMSIAGGWMPGRQLPAHSGSTPLAQTPIVWVTDKPIGCAGAIWADLMEEPAEPGLDGYRAADETFREWPGLRPFLLSGLDGGTARPWDTGELFGEPEDTDAIDALDAGRLLAGWWEDRVPSEDELAADREWGQEYLEETLAPFGTRFPGLASAVEEELDPDLMRRALFQYTRHARIGLVPAGRPADILPRLGFCVVNAGITGSELAAVLRSWEDRFGARLFEVGFDAIRLLVSRPPRTLEAAQRIAAEHFVFSDEAHIALRGIADIARAIVNNPFWDFWWD
jgi:hypothetical protein